MDLELILKDIKDSWVRENFFRIQRYLSSQVILSPEFEFFQVEIKGGESNFAIPHGLGFVPVDIVMLSVAGDFNFYFQYQDFDRKNIYVTTSGPVKLRFLAGRFENYNSRESSNDLFPLVPPSTGTTSGGGGATTWYTGHGVPAHGLGVSGDFYLNTETKNVYLKVGSTWSDQGYLGDQPPTRVQVTSFAGSTISALRPVYANTNTTVLNADISALPSSKILGVASNSATTGQTVTIITFGIMSDPSFSFAINSTLYVSSLGTLTTTPPTSGFLVRVGTSLGNGRIAVNIQEPIAL